MRYALLPLILLLALSASAEPDEPAPNAPAPSIEGKELASDVKWLADDDREGRAAGSPGALAAAQHIAAHFAALGLEGIVPEAPGSEGAYFQSFSLPRGVDVGDATGLVASNGAKSVELTYPDEDLVPLSVSSPGELEADAVFCGYGISAPELSYDDYADVDVKGRVVVILRTAPGIDDRKSPFASARARSRYATFPAKVNTAVAAGAAALVVLNDPAHCWKPKDDQLVHEVGEGPGKIPVLHVSYRAARRLAKVCGLSLQKEQKALDARCAPRSRLLEGVRIRVTAALEARRLPVRNVCARLRAGASDRAASEWLVIGGHYDHLGLGEYGSLAGSKGRGEIHNGADDNASGTAGVMQLATWLAARRELLRRDVVFVLFTGEELGLLGSKHFVEHPPAPLADCIAMVNLDMIGRLERGRLQIGGTGTSPVFEELLDAKNERHRVKTRYNPGGRAPSDNAPFYEKSVPVLFFFTGLHSDYHRPSDDFKDVDRRGLEKVVALAADVCLDLATRAQRPPFVRADSSAMATGPHLGISVEQRADGVYVNYVEPGSPAAKAGVRADDKIEEFDGHAIATTSDLTDAHSKAKPRAKVEILVRRGTRLVALQPKLGRN